VKLKSLLPSIFSGGGGGGSLPDGEGFDDSSNNNNSAIVPTKMSDRNGKIGYFPQRMFSGFKKQALSPHRKSMSVDLSSPKKTKKGAASSLHSKRSTTTSSTDSSAISLDDIVLMELNRSDTKSLSMESEKVYPPPFSQPVFFSFCSVLFFSFSRV
jgi:hypothetical protein